MKTNHVYLLLSVVLGALLVWSLGHNDPKKASTPSGFSSGSAADEAQHDAQLQFTQWVAWRAAHCRFVGDLEAGVFVCADRQTYPSSLVHDAQSEVPAGFHGGVPAEAVTHIRAATWPEPYQQAGKGRGYGSDAASYSRYGSSRAAPSYAAYLWYQQWRAWRAEHCTLHGRLDQGALFVCDDGQTYPTRITITQYATADDDYREPSMAPLDWLQRYRKAQYDNALPQAQQRVLPARGVPL